MDQPAETAGNRAFLGTNQSGMRARNERLVLTLLRRNGTMAKAELARATGLSAQTVSVIIRALEADGLLVKGKPQRGRIGQPSVPIGLNPDGAYFFGLKVGRRSSELIATDFVGRIRGRAKLVHAYPQFTAVIDFATSAIAEQTRHLGADAAGRIGGIGVALPFHLWSWATRIGVDPPLMADWQHRDFRAELEQRVGLPVMQQNDATSACSAELVFGTRPLPDNFLQFYIAFFIGGGLVLNGALFCGATGNAAAMGPLRIADRSGAMQPLMDRASLMHLESRVQAAGLDPMMLWHQPEGWDLPGALVDDWLDETAQALAQAVHAGMSLLDLDAVLIDGWMPQILRQQLVERVAENFERLDGTGITTPLIRSGTVGPDARALGAASLPLSARWLA